MSEAQVKLRDARADDINSIVKIHQTTEERRVLNLGLNGGPTQNDKDWFETHAIQRQHKAALWVAEDDSGILGWLTFSPIHGSLPFKNTLEIGICVSQAGTRKRVGDILLADAIKQSPKYGIKSLIGLSFANNHSSIALAEKHGFQQWGRLLEIAEIDGKNQDVVILGRKIV
jgi:phosphinothricin acetyltransferase